MKVIQKIGYSCLLSLIGLPIHHAFSQDNQVKKISNLNASAGITYFNLEKGTAVSESDTTQTGWDLAFQHTSIVLQSSDSGQLIGNITFEEITKAPVAGYQHGKAAIPAGSGNGWYSYNMDNHVISPIAGRVILIHTRSGKYVKLVIDSYYKGGSGEEPGNYTFHYAFIEPGQ